MDWLDYRDALGIGFADDAKFKFFITKIFNVIDDASDEALSQIDKSEYFAFCNMTGSKYEQSSYASGYTKIIKVLRAHSESLNDFLTYYVAFMNCQKDNQCKSLTKENYKYLLCNILREAHIPYDLKEDKDGYFVFPKGASELDDALVSEPLSWLSAYPKAHAAFIKALKEYANTTPDNASEVADKFRKTLETFFQDFFGGGRSLEKYISDRTYEQYLNKCGVPSEMRDEFKNTVNAYTKFINNNAKHHDKTDCKVLEYLMYQTGNIIRLLITLKQEESKDAN